MSETGRHPDALTTAAWIEGRLPPEARDPFEAHMADCDECRSGLAVLRLGMAEPAGGEDALPDEGLRRARSLGAGAPATTGTSLDESRWKGPGALRRRLIVPAGLAAALLAVAGAAVWWSQRADEQRASQAIERQEEGPVIETVAPKEGEVLQAADVEFRWQPVPGADRYVVSILDSWGAETAQIETATTRAPWPSDRAPLPVGTYLWSVRALAIDRIIAETRPAPFQVR